MVCPHCFSRMTAMSTDAPWRAGDVWLRNGVRFVLDVVFGRAGDGMMAIVARDDRQRRHHDHRWVGWRHGCR